MKFLLTMGATIVLLRHMQAVTRMSGVAAETTLSATDLRATDSTCRPRWGGLLVLLAATVLSVYKPWGMTPYGRRKPHELRKVSPADLPSHPGSDVGPGLGSATRTPRWVYVVGVHAVGLALLFVVMHLTGGGLRSY